MQKIYLAASWRNARQPEVVKLLRDRGHKLYDFRNPAPGEHGFSWSAVDVGYREWKPDQWAKLMGEEVEPGLYRASWQSTNPTFIRGYRFDKRALDWCNVCVCLLPCGRSAHLEAGYAIGQGKPTIFYISPDQFEPELMYLLSGIIVTSDDALLAALRMVRDEGNADVANEVEARELLADGSEVP